MIETNENKLKAERFKELLWSESPYKKGERMCLHPSYCREFEEFELIDVGIFCRDDFFPFEYNCKFQDGHTEWLKGHSLVKAEDK